MTAKEPATKRIPYMTIAELQEYRDLLIADLEAKETKAGRLASDIGRQRNILAQVEAKLADSRHRGSYRRD